MSVVSPVITDVQKDIKSAISYVRTVVYVRTWTRPRERAVSCNFRHLAKHSARNYARTVVSVLLVFVARLGSGESLRHARETERGAGEKMWENLDHERWQNESRNTRVPVKIAASRDDTDGGYAYYLEGISDFQFSGFPRTVGFVNTW